MATWTTQNISNRTAEWHWIGIGMTCLQQFGYCVLHMQNTLTVNVAIHDHYITSLAYKTQTIDAYQNFT